MRHNPKTVPVNHRFIGYGILKRARGLQNPTPMLTPPLLFFFALIQFVQVYSTENSVQQNVFEVGTAGETSVRYFQAVLACFGHCQE